MAGKGFYKLSSPAPLTHSLARVGAERKIPLRIEFLGHRLKARVQEKPAPSRTQLPENRLGLAARRCLLLGAEGVAFVALGSGISKGAAITAGLGLSAGTSLSGATEKVTLGGGRATSDTSPGRLTQQAFPGPL